MTSCAIICVWTVRAIRIHTSNVVIKIRVCVCINKLPPKSWILIIIPIGCVLFRRFSWDDESISRGRDVINLLRNFVLIGNYLTPARRRSLVDHTFRDLSSSHYLYRWVSTDNRIDQQNSVRILKFILYTWLATPKNTKLSVIII